MTNYILIFWKNENSAYAFEPKAKAQPLVLSLFSLIYRFIAKSENLHSALRGAYDVLPQKLSQRTHITKKVVRET